MSSAGKVTLDMTGLLNLKGQMLALADAKIKVGILGNHAARTDDGDNNPTIGAKHEFGAKDQPMPDGGRADIPARSWLRMPLMLRLPERIQKAGAQAFNLTAANKGTHTMLGQIGTEAVESIQDAFDTGGFGQWQKLSPRTVYHKNGNTQILIETQQLRKSVSYAVEGAP